jgi:chaperonin GroES
MIKPLPGYCLIEPIEDEEKSAGGVYLPESAKDKPMKGKVVDITYYVKESTGRIGELVSGYEMEKNTSLYYENKKGWRRVSVGDLVTYKKWTNQEVTHEGKEYLLVKFDELLAVIE